MRIVSNIITMGEPLPKYMLFYQMSSGIINTFSSSLIVNFLYYHDEHSYFYGKAICRSILSRRDSLNIVSDVNKFHSETNCSMSKKSCPIFGRYHQIFCTDAVGASSPRLYFVYPKLAQLRLTLKNI